MSSVGQLGTDLGLIEKLSKWMLWITHLNKRICGGWLRAQGAGFSAGRLLFPRAVAPRRNRMSPDGTPRIYVNNPKLVEKLAAKAAHEINLEVSGMWSEEGSKSRRVERAAHGNRGDVFVMSSSGAIHEDLQQMRRAKSAMPDLKVLLLGATQTEAELLQYLRAGIAGFLPAEATAEEIILAARALSNGQAICNGVQCAILFRYFEKEAESLPSAALHRDLGLTRREQQLIPFLTRGLTNKEIANHFSLSEQTVKNHLYRMKRKVGAQGRLEIVEVCRQHGFPS